MPTVRRKQKEWRQCRRTYGILSANGRSHLMVVVEAAAAAMEEQRQEAAAAAAAVYG